MTTTWSIPRRSSGGSPIGPGCSRRSRVRSSERFPRGGRGMGAGSSPWARGWRWPLGMAFSWLGPALGLEQAGALRLARAAYALAVVVGGIGIFPRAARNLARLRFDIDVLMGLAILGAMALGQWDEAATVAFLYGLSETLEALSLDYARRSIRALLELAPPTAERIGADGTTQVVAASQIRRGDRVLVRTGDTIPVDGTVALGRSSVDQKTITGESVPVLREEGDPVYAGTINGEGTLEVRASGPVGDALISRVIAQVRASQAGRAPIERRISRFAAVYTPLVIALVAPGHAGSTPVGRGHGRARRGRRGCLARVVWARPGGPGHCVSLCAGDRDAGGRRLWAGGRGAGGGVDPRG